MGKDTSNPHDKSGTPAALLVSIVCAIIVFALAEILNTFTLGESFTMRSVLVAYVGLGLALAFFWKRLERSPFLKISNVFFLFGLWVSLFMTTLAPILLKGESPLVHGQIMQQFGLGFVAFSGFMLVVALLQNQKMVPSLVLSSLGAVGLAITAGAGLFLKSNHEGEGSISSHSVKGHDEESEGEEITSEASHGSMAAKSSSPSEDEAAAAEHEEAEAEHGNDSDHDSHASESVFSKSKSVKAPKVPRSPVASLENAIPSATPKPASEPMKAVKHSWGYKAGTQNAAHDAKGDDYRNCSVAGGPKNILSAWPKMSDVSLDYKLTSLSIVDKGKALQFKVGKQNSMMIAGKKYELVEFHIQAASDHSIDGKGSPLEAHFVHKDEKNNLAILGVMIEAGAPHKSFGEMWEFVPQSLHNPATPIDRLFNIASLIPAKTKVYRYRGSHSMPPCSGNVLWSIASEKMTMSKEQIEAFRSRSKVNLRPAPVKLNLAH